MKLQRKIKIRKMTHSMVVCLSILALLFIGTASVSVRTVDAGAKTETGVKTVTHPAFISISISDGTGSMDKNEPIGGEKSMFLSIPAVIGGPNPDNNRPDTKAIGFVITRNVDTNCRSTLTTTAFISPKKAHEFTLIGAKPSGTS
jgi:hypothetical protein